MIKTIPQVVFAGFSEAEKQYVIEIIGEVPVDEIPPIIDGDEKDPDPIIRVATPLKRKYIAAQNAAICALPPSRRILNGQCVITIRFSSYIQGEDEYAYELGPISDTITKCYVYEFASELEKYFLREYAGYYPEKDSSEKKKGK